MSHNYTKFFTNSTGSTTNFKDSIPAGTAFGYPVPGAQISNVDDITTHAFFASSAEWEQIKNAAYDFIVIGTGPSGVAFIEQTLRHNPHAKIVVLERGSYFLPVHYQMLPMAFQNATGSPPTTYPWTRSSKMATTGLRMFQAGYLPILGGRSTYWSAWSPAPTPELMRDWPQELIDVTLQAGFWERAKRFLHVTSMDKIKNGVYGNLQKQLDENLKGNFKRFVPSALSAYPAPIAVSNTSWRTVQFYKYSTVGTLLGICNAQQALAAQGKGSVLPIVDHCIVERLLHDEQGSVTAIETSRGTLAVASAKIILAMGTIPPATLLMNSFKGKLANAGKRYTGHFMSHITARVKRSAFHQVASLELGALYLDGKDSQGLQYHVQVSAFASANPNEDQDTIAHEAPDAAAVASLPQLIGSEDYVVFVCATLGEVCEKNPQNWIKFNEGKDATCNITLQLIPGKEDHQLWNTLDEATYQTFQALTTSGNSTPEIEFWHEDGSNAGWHSKRPTQQQIRLNIIVHEASPLWMGKDPATSVVDLDYRPHGVNNVYLTGASIFPTSGSWNPTLTMCGLAQDLADRLK